MHDTYGIRIPKWIQYRYKCILFAFMHNTSDTLQCKKDTLQNACIVRPRCNTYYDTCGIHAKYTRIMYSVSRQVDTNVSLCIPNVSHCIAMYSELRRSEAFRMHVFQCILQCIVSGYVSRMYSECIWCDLFRYMTRYIRNTCIEGKRSSSEGKLYLAPRYPDYLIWYPRDYGRLREIERRFRRSKIE